MSRSQPAGIDLVCPECGRPSQAEIWAIVDAQENPELTIQIARNEINVVKCAHCGASGIIPAPFLLLHLGAAAAPIFSGDHRVDGDTLRRQLGYLLGMLRATPDVAWDDSWTTSTPFFPRLVLGLMLTSRLDATEREQFREWYLRLIASEVGTRPSPINSATRINLCEQTLELISKETEPRWWGTLHGMLAMELMHSTTGDRGANLESALDHARLTLEVFTIDAYPEEWAASQNNLGTLYSNRLEGDRATNLAQASHHYQEACKVYTPDIFPEEWAGAQNNIAGMLIAGHGETHLKDTEDALGILGNAIKVITREKYPEQWARLQSSLGVTHAAQVTDDRASHLEDAIFHFGQAATIYNRTDHPDEWSGNQVHLAQAHLSRHEGDPEENLEKARVLCEDVLAVLHSENSAERSAASHAILAEVCVRTSRGERSDQIVAALEHIREAEAFFTRETEVGRWARLQVLRAHALMQRVPGERPAHSEAQIAALNDALTGITRAKFPEIWAQAQHMLAIAYEERPIGDHAINLETAIKCCNDALSVYKREVYPREWALVVNTLATLYATRIYGDRAENLEQALLHNREAAMVLGRDRYPEDWTGLTLNLAGIYSQRMRGDPADNQEAGIAYCVQVLQQISRATAPWRWAHAHATLAELFRARTYGDPSRNREEAIRLEHEAMEVYTQAEYPHMWAACQNSLGGAYMQAGPDTSPSDVESAIACFVRALRATPRASDPLAWAARQHNLATAYQFRRHGRSAANMARASLHYRLSLEVLALGGDPVKCRNTALVVADLYFDADNWEQAVQYYQLAARADALLYQAATSRLAKEQEVLEGRGLYVQFAYALARLGELERAVEIIEHGRGRVLSDALESDRRDLQQLAYTGRPELLAEYGRIREQLDSIIRLAATGDEWEPSGFGRDNFVRIEALKQELQRTIAKIREEPGLGDFYDVPSFGRISSEIGARTVVYLMATRIGGLALSVCHGEVRAIWLDQLTGHAIASRFAGERGGSNGYIGAYASWMDSPHSKPAHDSWLAALDGMTRWLWDAVMAPVLMALAESPDFILIASGFLGFLPLHAAWTVDESSITGRTYALDHARISYAINARSFAHAQAIANRVQPTKMLIVQDPDGSLRYSQEEVAVVRHYFPENVRLSGKAASRAGVVRELQRANVFHFSAHGRSAWLRPLESSLGLADGKLSLGEVLRLHLPGARLAVLSACETSLPGGPLLDEAIGFPSVLAEAGVAGVIGSLWSVQDLSTAILVARFYDYWRGEKLEPAEALRRAQIWLRDTTAEEKLRYLNASGNRSGSFPFSAGLLRTINTRLLAHSGLKESSHLYHWAAFTYTGA